MKPVVRTLFCYCGDDWSSYDQAYDPKTTMTESQRRRVIELSRLVTFADKSEFEAQVGEFVDLDKFAKFISIQVILTDLDGILGPGQNFYLYLDPISRKFEFIPWDQDQSLGRGAIVKPDERINLSIHKPWYGADLFLARMFEARGFKQRYLNCIGRFVDASLRTDRIDTFASVTKPYLDEDSNAARSGAVDDLRSFMRARHNAISNQLANSRIAKAVAQIDHNALPTNEVDVFSLIDSDRNQIIDKVEFGSLWRFASQVRTP